MKYNLILPFIIAIACFMPSLAEAVPALSNPHFAYQQGTLFRIQTVGDECNPFHVAEDGYVLQQKDGVWYYTLPQNVPMQEGGLCEKSTVQPILTSASYLFASPPAGAFRLNEGKQGKPFRLSLFPLVVFTLTGIGFVTRWMYQKPKKSTHTP